MSEYTTLSLEVLNTDNFCNMPASTQLLYVMLCMNADDFGVVHRTRGIMRERCCKEVELEMLISKGFVNKEQDGTFRIVHWDIHCEKYEVMTYNDGEPV